MDLSQDILRVAFNAMKSDLLSGQSATYYVSVCNRNVSVGVKAARLRNKARDRFNFYSRVKPPSFSSQLRNTLSSPNLQAATETNSVSPAFPTFYGLTPHPLLSKLLQGSPVWMSCYRIRGRQGIFHCYVIVVIFVILIQCLSVIMLTELKFQTLC